MINVYNVDVTANLKLYLGERLRAIMHLCTYFPSNRRLQRFVFRGKVGRQVKFVTYYKRIRSERRQERGQRMDAKKARINRMKTDMEEKMRTITIGEKTFYMLVNLRTLNVFLMVAVRMRVPGTSVS